MLERGGQMAVVPSGRPARTLYHVEEAFADFEALLVRLDELGRPLEEWTVENCPDVPPGFFTS